ncbi:GntR family transcriptional regulator [Pseudomonas matsuisoli]|nr:GntR family transcriptional regulator [Pseudomonas matsuisoli]
MNKKHLNNQLFELILASIQAGRLQPGTLLLEGPLADIFGVSRSPVRQALARLSENGLIQTFEGRGYLVGTEPATPQRRPLCADDFAIAPARRPKRTESWQGVYDAIERELLQHSLFGSHRINELELSRHFSISRTVSNQVLTRLQLMGLLEKDERSRWLVPEWDEQRLADLYEIRRRLEPYVLSRAAEHLPKARVVRFIDRLQEAVEQYPEMESRHFDDLESDLHIRTLGYCPNRQMLTLLQRTHSLLLSGKHILLDKSYFPEEEPFFQEHLAVFESLREHRVDQACAYMEEHLLIAERKVSQRLTQFKMQNTVEDVPFLERVG